jgi:chromate transporter
MPADASPSNPGLLELLTAFAGISVASFGGALPWSRRMIVEKRRWMSAEDFNEAFSFAQFLPGPNTVNFAVVFGSRFAGPAGALAALLGLLGPPVAIITIVAVLYSYYGDLAVLGRILAGVSASAAGLLIAMAAKMATPLFRRRTGVIAPAIAAITFAAVGPLHLPLQWVLLVMAPVSVAFAWMRR